MKKTKNRKVLEKFKEDLVKETVAEFEKRRANRLAYERQWELNLAFASGKQYVDFDFRGDISEKEKKFFWQERGVYNHISTLIETRIAKLLRVNPVLSVRPASDDDGEINNARLAEKILSDTFSKQSFANTVRSVTKWSEYCGTGFYKVVWNADGGAKIGTSGGKDVYEGEVDIISVSPFAIFPDNLSAENLDFVNDLIFARAASINDVKANYGIKTDGENLQIIGGGELENSVLLIERYIKPDADFPNGRLIVVAGDKLAYYGDLPYVNGKDGRRTFPFVMQTACSHAGEFFGRSVIERLIPVQRAYNAVKNRKHEFLNRLTMGVVAVEDGSVDTDDLESEGLPPGKLIVYRQGSKAPEIVTENALPPDFENEENRLLNEFVTVSGVSEVASNSENGRVTSGTALELLIEQDNVRLTATAESVRGAYLQISTQVLRLYREFMVGMRALKTMDEESRTKVYYVDKNVLTSDDVIIMNENELLYGENKRRSMLLELYKSGVFNGSDGKLRTETKSKILSLLGYADVDGESALLKLHEEKARRENKTLLSVGIEADVYDEHSLHIDEHTRYALSEDENLSAEEKMRFAEHIKSHRREKGENNG